MIDTGYEIRVGYMKALSGFAYKGKVLITYDEIADEDDNSQFYFVISGQTSADNSLKCGFSSLDLISLNIVSKYNLGSGTKMDVETIGSVALQLLLPAPGKTGIITPNLNIWDSVLITNRNIIDETSSERIITKIITIQHRVNHIS